MSKTPRDLARLKLELMRDPELARLLWAIRRSVSPRVAAVLAKALNEESAADDRDPDRQERDRLTGLAYVRHIAQLSIN